MVDGVAEARQSAQELLYLPRARRSPSIKLSLAREHSEGCQGSISFFCVSCWI